MDLTDPVATTTVETMMTPVIRTGTEIIQAVAGTGGATGIAMNLQDVAEPSVRAVAEKIQF